MATKKKTKTKTKKAKKKASARKAARKQVARKPAGKKAAAKKKRKTTAAKRSAPKPRAGQPARPPAQAPAPAPVAPLPGERIGVVTHYFNHLSVAIIDLDAGGLRVGDMVHIKGHTSDFTQRVESMEVDHVHVSEVRPGQSFGLRVREHAREHDVVYKVAH